MDAQLAAPDPTMLLEFESLKMEYAGLKAQLQKIKEKEEEHKLPVVVQEDYVQPTEHHGPAKHQVPSIALANVSVPEPKVEEMINEEGWGDDEIDDENMFLNESPSQRKSTTVVPDDQNTRYGGSVI